MEIIMKKIILLILISLTTNSFANSLDIAPPILGLTNPIIVQKALDSGVVFTSNNVQYQLILGGQAVNSSSNNVSEMSSSSNGSNLLSIQKGPYQLFIPGAITPGVSTPGALTMSPSAGDFKKIAYNPESGGIGIVVGDIIVKLKPGVTAESIASSYGINLSNNFESINTAVYRTYSWQNIFAIAQQLSLDPGIEFAELDIIENFDQPN